MKLITSYILSKYLKNFIIVLLSLELFFIGIDFLQNFSKIPDSANLQLLYLAYNAFFTLTLTLPLALVFGWIITLIVFIKNNEFVSFLSLGSSPKLIYKPIAVFSFLILSFLVLLQATPLAYSYEQRGKIMDGNYFIDTKDSLFLKYNEYFIYFGKLYAEEQRAENIHIFKLEGKDIVESIVAKKALFKNGTWQVFMAKKTIKPMTINFDVSKIKIEYIDNLEVLKGFKPKILDSVYEAKSTFSILDAAEALFLLNDQKINTTSVRSSLYYQAFIPFFIIPVILIVFVASSINSRFFNVAKFSSITIFFTLIVWGVFFMLHKLSQGGIAIPEVALLLPLLIWFIVGYFIFKKRINNY